MRKPRLHRQRIALVHKQGQILIMYLSLLMHLTYFLYIDEVVGETKIPILLTPTNTISGYSNGSSSSRSSSSGIPSYTGTYVSQELPFNLSNSASWESSYLFNNEEYFMSFNSEELLSMKVNHKMSQDIDMDPCKSGRFL